ncbi:glycerate kinase [Parafrigoribacterium humi]|jgi:glycerate kinase|uniref:glycerate kinase n=1 Tax=Parafrigoribacterium humi TaxID=3144664 RepID=UPI0032ED2C72
MTLPSVAATSVIVAVDSFKGTISASSAAAAICSGWRSVDPHAKLRPFPMADGGEGTLAAFLSAVPGARRMPLEVDGPGGIPVQAAWVLLPPTQSIPGGTAVVELAGTSGIELLGSTRLRPMDADSLGLGQAIAAALAHGVSRLVVGIGSSASTDGGMGLLSALGARFMDGAGVPVARGGRGLGSLETVDLSDLTPVPSEGVVVLADVTNPLLGSRGAAAVFGPQKGASPEEVATLESGLARLAGLVGSDPMTAGAGAAGGTGYALLAWGAQLVPGSATIAELVGVHTAIEAATAEATLIVTGEGSFDGQSAGGKVPHHVAGLAARAGIPIALVAGRVAPDADTSTFVSVLSLTTLAGSAAAAIASPERWLTVAGAQLARRFGSSS